MTQEFDAMDTEMKEERRTRRNRPEQNSDAVTGYAKPTIRSVNDGPLTGRNVLAIVEHFHTKGQRYAVLYSVKEDDLNWRTVDDNSELSHDWDVIAWDYLPVL